MLSLGFGGSVGAQPSTTAAVARRVLPATATVLALDARGDTIGQGSAFFVDSAGTLVTNYHVLRGAADALILVAGRAPRRVASVEVANAAADIAVVVVRRDARDGHASPALPVRYDVPPVGERAIAIGSPLGLSQTVTEGIVSAVRDVEAGPLVQITAAISPGSSGGPILDAQGRVFAIATSYLAGGQQLNFAVPMSTVRALRSRSAAGRSVADAFGARTAPVERSASPDSRSGRLPALSPAIPGPGEYGFTEYVVDETGARVRSHGIAVLGDQTGLTMQVVSTASDEIAHHVFYVENFLRYPDGRVLLTTHTPYEGVARGASGGFVVESTHEYQGRTVRLRIDASPTRLRLGQPNGLYAVQGRLAYHAAEDLAIIDHVEWSGELALVATDDSVHVALYLTNADGGNTGFLAAGPRRPDQLVVVPSRDGSKEVSFWLAAGRLQLAFTDRRSNGGVFRGTLEAVRR